MAETRTRWTREEDEILVQAIKANPHNKAQAFKIAAEKVNHSEASCASRWYARLSNPTNKNYVGCMFTMIGAASKLDNRTVNREGGHVTPTKTPKGLWSKIKKLLSL